MGGAPQVLIFGILFIREVAQDKYLQ